MLYGRRNRARYKPGLEYAGCVLTMGTMTAKKIIWGQVLIVFLIVLTATWGATRWVDSRLGFQAHLGSPWFDLIAMPIYPRPTFFW